MPPRKTVKPAEIEAPAEEAVKKSARKPKVAPAVEAKVEAKSAAPKAEKAKAPAKAPKADKVAPKAKAAPKTKIEVVAEPAPPAVVPNAVPVAPLAEATLIPEATQVLQAIQNGRAIELIFKDADANPPRTFEPRHLLFDALSQAWFVWGWDRRYNAERHHRLDLISEVNLVEGPGRAAQGPFKEGTPANLIGGWLGGDPIAVKVILLKQWIFAVKQAPPAFPEFRIEDQEEGKALVSFVGTDLRAIARWVLQFGDGAQVLEPQRLIDRVKQVGIVWGGKPVAAAPAPAPRPEREHREARHARPEPRESRPEARPEPRPERRPEPRREEKREESKPKGAKVEVRFERL